MPNQSAPTPAQASILIVEDDPDTLMILEDLLATAGYCTAIAKSGEAALVTLDAQPFDLVLLDLRLPGIGGYEVAQQLREGRHAMLPVIMLTANRAHAGVVQGFQFGTDDYVTKPFAPAELLSRISRLLVRDQLLRESLHEGQTLQELLRLVKRDLEQSRTSSATELILRREFLHNVSVHFQALCGVIEGEYRRTPPGPGREVVQRILGRVQGAALVYQVSELLQDEPAQFDQVVQLTVNALKSIYSPRRRLPVEIQGGPLALPLAYASPLALMANELITNAFKHAFPDQRFGKITISYGVNADQLWFTVADDGVGLPAGWPGTTRGRTTVEQLAQYLGGTATWQPTPPGLRVEVRVPVPPPPAAE